MLRAGILVVLVGCLVSLASCAGSINKSRPVSGSRIDYVDSRQRAVIVNAKNSTTTTTIVSGKARVKQKSPTTKITNFRSCSEPSPDVFTALAASFGGDASLLPSGETRVAVASALSENAAAIQRTQTANLLRESFFRTCERFLNGAITEAEMIVQSARDQRAMVSVLAIEQLTGTVTASPIVLQTNASATVSGEAHKVITEIKDARDKAAVAEAKATADKAESDGAETKNKCPDIRAKTEASRTDKEKTDLATCDEKAATASASQQAAKVAKDYYDAVRTVSMASQPVSAVAGGSGSLLANTPTPYQPPTPADRAAVADAVSRIVKDTFLVDEYTMLCIRTLSGKDGADRSENSQLATLCLDVIKQGLSVETILRANVAESQLLSSNTVVFFSPVSDWLTKGEGGNLKKNLQCLETAYRAEGGRGVSPQFFTSTTIDEARREFTTLGPVSQGLLARLAQKPPPCP